MGQLNPDDFRVTPERTADLVRKIVAAVDPLEVIVFGSQANGQARPDSDLDLAVIVEERSREIDDRIRAAVGGRSMAVDLILLDKATYDQFRPWIGTLEKEIDQKGIRMYARDRQSADSQAA